MLSRFGARALLVGGSCASAVVPIAMRVNAAPLQPPPLAGSSASGLSLAPSAAVAIRAKSKKGKAKKKAMEVETPPPPPPATTATDPSVEAVEEAAAAAAAATTDANSATTTTTDDTTASLARRIEKLTKVVLMLVKNGEAASGRIDALEEKLAAAVTRVASDTAAIAAAFPATRAPGEATEKPQKQKQHYYGKKKKHRHGGGASNEAEKKSEKGNGGQSERVAPSVKEGPVEAYRLAAAFGNSLRIPANAMPTLKGGANATKVAEANPELFRRIKAAKGDDSVLGGDEWEFLGMDDAATFLKCKNEHTGKSIAALESEIAELKKAEKIDRVEIRNRRLAILRQKFPEGLPSWNFRVLAQIVYDALPAKGDGAYVSLLDVETKLLPPQVAETTPIILNTAFFLRQWKLFTLHEVKMGDFVVSRSSVPPPAGAKDWSAVGASELAEGVLELFERKKRSSGSGWLKIHSLSKLAGPKANKRAEALNGWVSVLEARPDLFEVNNGAFTVKAKKESSGDDDDLVDF